MTPLARPDGEPDPHALRDLEARLQRSLRAGERVPSADADDVVQSAFARLVAQRNKERSKGSDPWQPRGAPLESHAFMALRDERADYFRRAQRQPPLQDEADELAPEACEFMDQTVDLGDLIIRIAGPDVWDYFKFSSRGYTQAAIAKLPGWTPERAERARRQRDRKIPEIQAAVSAALS